eukprot:5102506-Prymnesium_polylepis.1
MCIRDRLRSVHCDALPRAHPRVQLGRVEVSARSGSGRCGSGCSTRAARAACHRRAPCSCARRAAAA